MFTHDELELIGHALFLLWGETDDQDDKFIALIEKVDQKKEETL